MGMAMCGGCIIADLRDYVVASSEVEEGNLWLVSPSLPRVVCLQAEAVACEPYLASKRASDRQSVRQMRPQRRTGRTATLEVHCTVQRTCCEEDVTVSGRFANRGHLLTLRDFHGDSFGHFIANNLLSCIPIVNLVRTALCTAYSTVCARKHECKCSKLISDFQVIIMYWGLQQLVSFVSLERTFCLTLIYTMRITYHSEGTKPWFATSFCLNESW